MITGVLGVAFNDWGHLNLPNQIKILFWVGINQNAELFFCYEAEIHLVSLFVELVMAIIYKLS